ncbi:hypothetical protein SSP24_39530 [Streptomyces spinoverrucosus]|uniref:Uncharacterized protein n=2 Tax=Streptomyces spinoverrucosus TaxID=284043 RepID=A0A4Y3VJH3_9ACTN|nr:hypothetical protein SSP24_39530 [Streptomyces spinoverrucosus]GHB75998.1 hypothetical protein GCM10010397_53100 [Streptomyces spinoverrucosus]
MSALMDTIVGMAEDADHPLLVALSIFAPGAVRTAATGPQEESTEGRSAAAVAAHLGRLGLGDA